MKPITADNNDGRVLLALRAGEMTPGELSERGLHFPGWLIKAGYVVQFGGYYRITDAGRVACPFRNPLAAAAAAPARQEINMPKENIVTRQEVLAAIVAAGPAGTTCKRLIEQFNCGEQVIYNHVSLLGKAAIPVIFKPEKGRIVAIKFNDRAAALKPQCKSAEERAEHRASRENKEPAESATPVIAPAPLLPEMAELAVREETIEIKGIADRRGPITMMHPDETEIGIFSNGRIEITDEFNSVLLTDGVVRKLRQFLGLFAEVS